MQISIVVENDEFFIAPMETGCIKGGSNRHISVVSREIIGKEDDQ